MENVNEEQVVPTQEASGVPENDSKQDQVSYESFRKSVEAEKNARKRAQELESQLEQIKMAELEKAGKHEEIISSLRSKVSETESKYNEMLQRHQWEKVTGTIKTKSLEHGCLAPDKLVRLLDKNDFMSLTSEDGNINTNSVEMLIEKAKKENGFLFNKGEVRINDITPKFDGTPTTKPFNQMNDKEKLDSLKASLGKVLR